MPMFNPKDHIGGKGNATKLEPGDYQVFVKDMEMREGKKAPYYYVRLEVFSGPCKGARLAEILSHSDSPYCKVKLAEFVYSFGYTESFDTEKDFNTLRAAATNNQTPITVTIDYEDSRGDDEPRLRVKSFHPQEIVGSPADELADVPGADDDIPF